MQRNVSFQECRQSHLQKVLASQCVTEMSEAQIARERGAKRINGIPIEEQDTYEMKFF